MAGTPGSTTSTGGAPGSTSTADGTASDVPDGARASELPETKAEVRARREALRAALVDLEDVLSRPVGDLQAWWSRVRSGVEHLHTTLQEHVRETESEGGLLAQLEEDAPWLEGRVQQLRRDHDQLLSDSDALLADCRTADAPDQLRESALELLRAISRHRHEGTDLLYDAYMVDISAAD